MPSTRHFSAFHPSGLQPEREPARCTATTWRRTQGGHLGVGLCDLELDEHGRCPFDGTPLHK